MNRIIRLISIVLLFSIFSLMLGSCNNPNETEDGGEKLLLEQKWNDLVVNKGAKTVCVVSYWAASSTLEKERKIDDEKISDLLALFEGITLSRLDETFFPGVLSTAYSFNLLKSSLVFDENGIVKKSEWKKLKDEGLNIIVESDGYVYVKTEDGWYKSDLTVDCAEIREYHNQATEFDIIYDIPLE